MWSASCNLRFPIWITKYNFRFYEFLVPSLLWNTCIFVIPVIIKDQIVFLFLRGKRLLEDLNFFSMIICLLHLLRGGVVFTASLHYYIFLASVQAFTLLSFGGSFTEKWTLMSGGSVMNIPEPNCFCSGKPHRKRIKRRKFSMRFLSQTCLVGNAWNPGSLATM